MAFGSLSTIFTCLCQLEYCESATCELWTEVGKISVWSIWLTHTHIRNGCEKWCECLCVCVALVRCSCAPWCVYKCMSKQKETSINTHRTCNTMNVYFRLGRFTRTQRNMLARSFSRCSSLYLYILQYVCVPVRYIVDL